jgi:hypothetical protein
MITEYAFGLLTAFKETMLNVHRTNHKDAHKLLRRNPEERGPLQNTSIHIWRFSPFRAVASLIIRLHSSLFAALLFYSLIPKQL